MRIGWAAVFAPVLAAIPIGLASFVTNPEWLNPVVMIWALVLGLPVAVAYSVATTYFLGQKLLRSGVPSFVYCALWGAILATVTAFAIVGTDPLTFALVTWGAIAGLLFRTMSGVAPA
jgi:hypothetical protein